MQETVTIDSNIFNILMVAMYGIFSLMVIVVGAYIALFKRSIESKMDAGFDRIYLETSHVIKDVAIISETQDRERERLTNHITDCNQRRCG